MQEDKTNTDNQNSNSAKIDQDLKGDEERESQTPPYITVVIPIHNEESILENAVSALLQNLSSWRPGLAVEIILAENGSRDATFRIARKLERQHQEISALSLDEPNYGAALKAGILKARGKWIICDEIDLCDVGFHSRAVAILEREEADLVIGSKTMVGAHDHRPLPRRLATKVINNMLKIMLGFTGTDTHGLKAFHREKLLSVARRCVVDKDLFASEFVIRAERSRVRIKEIPIEVAEKRPPSVDLVRRVPNVLKNMAVLFYALRIHNNNNKDE